MAEEWTAAVYGATGALGREVRVGLEGHDVPFTRVVPVAGVRSAGEVVPWRGERRTVIAAREVDPSTLDYAFFAVPVEVAKAEIPALRARGVFVVDLSGARHAGGGDPLPVVWPELGEEALEDLPGGLALPGAAASTVAPIVDAVARAGVVIRAIDVVELASAGDAGREGPEALSKQTVGLLSYTVFDAAPFREPLAFSVLDAAAGEPARAARFADEMAALLPAISAPCRLTTLLIPAFAGVTVVCTLHTRGPVPSLADLAAALDAHPDLELVPEGAVLRDAMEADRVQLSPPRLDPDGTIRIVAVADPLHRIGDRAARLVKRVLAEDLG